MQLWKPFVGALTIAAPAIMSLSALQSDGINTEAGERLMSTATGSFEVAMSPEGESIQKDGLSYGQYSNKKTFTGDLVGQSEGTMLTAMTPIENSAGYVLIEHFAGSLDGREGGFALQHSSTMARGEQRQSIIVVPDSGTGELEGLNGSMVVDVSADGHRYTFEYSLSD